MAAILRKFDTCSTTKTYASYENASDAFLKKYGNTDISYIVVKLDEDNCNNKNHYGRFIPVAIGVGAVELGIHFDFHIIA